MYDMNEQLDKFRDKVIRTELLQLFECIKNICSTQIIITIADVE